MTTDELFTRYELLLGHYCQTRDGQSYISLIRDVMPSLTMAQERAECAEPYRRLNPAKPTPMQEPRSAHYERFKRSRCPRWYYFDHYEDAKRTLAERLERDPECRQSRVPSIRETFNVVPVKQGVRPATMVWSGYAPPPLPSLGGWWGGILFEPGVLYPIPELTVVKERDGILIVEPNAALAASEVLQNQMAFIEDADHPAEVVTGIAVAPMPGSAEERLVRRWIDQLVMSGYGVIVFLHSVVNGPLRFVATRDPALMAALTMPVGTQRNYAVLQAPSYLVLHAQQLAQGGKIMRELPHAETVSSFTEQQYTMESAPADQGAAPAAATSAAGWRTFAIAAGCGFVGAALLGYALL